MRAIHKIAVLSAAVVAFGTIGAGTALADPYPPLSSPPALNTIEGVGSDTITPLFSGNETYVNGVAQGGQTSGDITQDYDATNPSNLLYSWDAVNPSTGASGDTITTKASGSGDTSCSFSRPDGSSAGISQLNDNQTDSSTFGGQTVYCVDYARASRAPNSSTFDDTFVTLALDSIDWSYPVVSGETNPQPTSLTLGDLTDIYNCTDTNWSDFGGPNDPIVPVLPQSGSGTRATFLLALGSDGTPLTPGSCVVNGTDPFSTASPAPVIEENTGLSTGNEDVFDHSGTFDWPLGQTTTTADSADVIYPYSIGDYIAQGSPVTGTGSGAGGATVGGHATAIWGQGDSAFEMTLGETVNGSTAEAPTSTNADGQPVINYNHWVQQLNRNLYAVVRNGYDSVTGSEPTSSADADFPTTPSYEATALPAIFGSDGWICTSTAGQSDIVSYGFTQAGNNCGALTAGD
jgi:ABC-type phosphate transport system substrate-binding protein